MMSCWKNPARLHLLQPAPVLHVLEHVAAPAANSIAIARKSRGQKHLRMQTSVFRHIPCNALTEGLSLGGQSLLRRREDPGAL